MADQETWLNTPLWKEVNKIRFALRNAKGSKRDELLKRLDELNKKIEALPRAPKQE